MRKLNVYAILLKNLVDLSTGYCVSQGDFRAWFIEVCDDSFSAFHENLSNMFHLRSGDVRQYAHVGSHCSGMGCSTHWSAVSAPYFTS